MVHSVHNQVLLILSEKDKSIKFVMIDVLFITSGVLINATSLLESRGLARGHSLSSPNLSDLRVHLLTSLPAHILTINGLIGSDCTQV